MNKFIIWIKQDEVAAALHGGAAGTWEPNGEGPLTQKQADRIVRETRRGCAVYPGRLDFRILPCGQVPVVGG